MDFNFVGFNENNREDNSEVLDESMDGEKAGLNRGQSRPPVRDFKVDFCLESFSGLPKQAEKFCKGWIRITFM